jgi:hypothetical protein
LSCHAAAFDATTFRELLLNPPMIRHILVGMKHLLILALAALSLPAIGQNQTSDPMPVRGFCIGAPSPKEVDRFITFIDSELAPRQVNTLVLRVEYSYQFHSRPEMTDARGLSRDDVKKLVAACKKDNIKLIPEIDCLGHQSFGSHLGALLRVHPEFDETPQVAIPKDYKWPNADKLYCKSYCPLHPQVNEVVFALMDELCDDFESDTFHAGMDEVFYIGETNCPRCAGKDRSQLFAGEITALDGHLRDKGRHLWIWGDRLLDGKTTGLGEWEASENDTFRAIDLIPKDVTICDWHYERPDATPVYFAMKGFNVMICPWRLSPPGVLEVDDMAHWQKTSSDKMKPRFLGVMQTTWSGVGGFLDREYKSDPAKTNSWNCFKAVFDEIAKTQSK